MAIILVTGSNGQLGSELQQLAPSMNGLDFLFTDVDTLDICNKTALEDFVASQPIDFIINCAAYTAVDKAEDDVERCYAINRDAVRNLGEVAAAIGCKVIHVSTDYVFNGKSYRPYTEEMQIAPDTIYGKSKAEGEEELLRVCMNAVILRTSWLYSAFGNNFVKTMLKLGKERDTLSVIYDQIGTPTYAADLAAAILEIVHQAIEDDSTFKTGTYHFSNEGVCSWYDFAVAIHRLAGLTCDVQPIESWAYPAKAPRPFYSVLNKAKFKATFHIPIAHWEESLSKCITLLVSK
jgi:dTDP-4-dehydrorhamnose reductase